MGFDALTDEKDPVVRAYTENLRRQVADIAAKYGANARDLFRAEVQERMEIEDLVSVAGLVKRIGIYSGDTIPARESADLRHELDRRERRAEELLTGVFDGVVELDERKETMEQMARWFLRANLIQRAYDVIDKGDFASDEGLARDVRIAYAVSIAKIDPIAAREIFRRQEGSFDALTGGFLADTRTVLASFDAKFPILTDSELEDEAWTILSVPATLRPIVIHRYLPEIRRRGMSSSSDDVKMLVRDADDIGRTNRMFADNQAWFRIVRAELMAASGDPISASIPLRQAVSDAAVRMKTNDHRARKETLAYVETIAETAGKVGAFSLLENLVEICPSYILNATTDRNPRVAMANGCIAAKNFDMAWELIRSVPGDRRGVGMGLMVALFDDNQLHRGERAYLEFVGSDLNVLRATDVFITARAMRGDDMIDTVVKLAEDRRYATFGLSAAVAIATIGFTTAMKKRLGV